VEAAAPANGLPTCGYCQAKLPSDAHFCLQCGAPVDGALAGANADTTFVQSLLSLARGLSSTQDVDALLKRIGQSAEQMLLCEASSIMLLDDDKQNLFFKVATGEKGGVVTRYKIKLGEGVAGQCAQKRESILINDVSSDNRFAGRYDQISGFKTRSILCAPMIAGGELVGVLEVLNKKAGSGFSAGDQSLLESLAGLGAMAIGNARVVGGFRNFYSNTIEILISAIEARDMRMAGHCFRVAQRASSLGRRLGLEGQVLKDLYYSALLHDIGFLKVSGGWNAPRVLVMESPHSEQTHPLIGAEMVRGVQLLKGAATLIEMHHENYDGSGFPRGLKGDEIPMGGYILSTIEACEEMRMEGYSEEQVLDALESQAGKKFNPQVAAAYHDVLLQESRTGTI
jgi:HD-GYP domain-containing protein (c-di-GMP phosphodiesterase class II)